MNKIFTLAKVLAKCGSGSEAAAKGNSAKAALTGKILLLIFGSGLMGFAGYKMSALLPFIGNDISVMFSTFYLAGFVASLFLTIPPIINQLYMSTDLPELLVMPFTSFEIVMARMINIAVTPIITAFITSVPGAIGYMAAVGFDGNLLLSSILAFISIPIIAICGVSVIIMLIMTFVHALRNRDHLKVIGGVLFMLLFAGYYIFINSGSTSNIDKETLGGVFSATGKASVVFFVNPMLTKLSHGFDAVSFIAVIAICAAFAALFVLVAKAFYLKGAINMQTTSSLSRQLTDESLAKDCRQRSAFSSFFVNDLKTVKRNPDYLVQGFLYPIFMPILMVVVMALALKGIFVEDFDLNDLPPYVMLCVGFMLSCLMSAVASTMNVISASTLSREGESIYFLSAMPIDYKQYLRAKKFVPMLISALGSTDLLLIGGIILTAMGITPIWFTPYLIFVNIPLVWFFTCLNMLFDIKNPSFSWDNEAQMIKSRLGVKTIIAFCIAFAAAYGGPFAAMWFFSEVPSIIYVIFLGVPALLYAAAFIMDRAALKAGMAKLRKL